MKLNTSETLSGSTKLTDEIEKIDGQAQFLSPISKQLLKDASVSYSDSIKHLQDETGYISIREALQIEIEKDIPQVKQLYRLKLRKSGIKQP